MSDKIMVEEYKALRQEHENNRKFIFERPLVIIVGIFAAMANFKGMPTVAPEILPTVLLAVLWFNLWFTYNRIISSARIVAYIQLVHEDPSREPWIGWENSLVLHRAWQREASEEEVAQLWVEASLVNANGFYEIIFYFHVLGGLLLSVLAFSQSDLMPRIADGTRTGPDTVWLIYQVAVIVTFLLGARRYLPSKVRPAIAFHTAIWKKVLPGIREA